MIDFVTILDTNREPVGIIDAFNSIIWNPSLYGAGNFEIYVAYSPENSELLKEGYFVSRQNNKFTGIIERVEVETVLVDGDNQARMINAVGRFTKSILDRRIIYKTYFDAGGVRRVQPTILSGNVETAVRQLINDNSLIEGVRNIPILTLGDLVGITTTLTEEKQVTYDNLLTYSDSFLQENLLGAYCVFDENTKLFKYTLIDSVDKSVDNTDGNEPLIFSVEFDNLIDSSYVVDSSTYKNTAMIGGEGEGTEKFTTILNNENSGLFRREVFVDASGIKQTYKNERDQEVRYTNAEYNRMLLAKGDNSLVKMQRIESFDGSLDFTNSNLVLEQDYDLNYLITMADRELGIYINARIVAYLETQDKDGYSIEIEYGN